ncbi:MAG: Zn-dependent hydrolase [Patulibacter sp.]|nr:Zn-dependent hydrolase [Patulibacter sp.]
MSLVGLTATPDPGPGTVAELRELHALTADADGGAERLAWTPGWVTARNWLTARLDEVPVPHERDEAGNLWATLAGAEDGAVVVGSHLDAVPGGGWLDGTLGVLAGLAAIRELARGPRTRRSVSLVDWADEEGARFGHSLLGSSAAAGTLDVDRVAALRDRDGRRLADVLAEHGVDVATMTRSRDRLAGVRAYAELHIEQGPVLDAAEVGLGVVSGTLGVERHEFVFTGRAVHAGGTPMELRHDALAAAARLALAVREIAREHGGVATCGRIDADPGVATAVAGEATVLVDLRHAHAPALGAMLRDARAAAGEIASAERVSASDRPLHRTAPLTFDADLLALAHDAATTATGAPVPTLASGPLHDAAAVAATGIPVAMLFVRSLGGVSHTRAEDSRADDLAAGVRALALLTRALAER